MGIAASKLFDFINLEIKVIFEENSIFSFSKDKIIVFSNNGNSMEALNYDKNYANLSNNIFFYK